MSSQSRPNPANTRIHEVVDRVERELGDLVRYINDEVVPTLRNESTRALRIAAEKLSKLADTMDDAKRP